MGRKEQNKSEKIIEKVVMLIYLDRVKDQKMK